MFKLVQALAKFLLFSLVGYTLLLFFWGYSGLSKHFRSNLNYKLGSYGHLYTRIREARSITGVDFLILGSSHAYRGFDPRYFQQSGYRIFNLGSSAQTPLQAEILLARYLDKINPKAIIYEVYPGSFCSDGVESSVDVIANDRNDCLSLSMAIRVNNIRTYNTLAYALMAGALDLNAGFIEAKEKGDNLYIQGGYVQKTSSHFTSHVYSRNSWNLNKEQLKAFERIMENIKMRNIKVILVYAPITSSFYSSFDNNKTYDSVIASYGRYYNFNEIVRLNDTLHFYDGHHLNQKGVEIFNKKLIEVLKLNSSQYK